jgi:hypothetical protein
MIHVTPDKKQTLENSILHRSKTFWLATIPAFIFATLVMIFFPVYLKPKMLEDAVLEAEELSNNAATHFAKVHLDQLLADDAETKAKTMKIIGEHIISFKLWKVRLFDPDGKILYSTLEEEIGTTTAKGKPFFVNIVSKGKSYSKVVKKEMRTATGPLAPYDVAETYIPIMEDGVFKGALEVYVNITPHMARMNTLFWGAYGSIGVIVFLLLTITIGSATRINRSQRARDAVIQHLEAALAEIRTLKGILPICAACKKVRDDDGYWHQVESYVRDHSEAEFSHSYCPECAKKAMEEAKQYGKANEEPSGDDGDDSEGHSDETQAES